MHISPFQVRLDCKLHFQIESSGHSHVTHKHSGVACWLSGVTLETNILACSILIARTVGGLTDTVVSLRHNGSGSGSPAVTVHCYPRDNAPLLQHQHTPST